ncbi:mechanosensitive ion channel family protein [bacterium]|nr:mechanosensitive ion channel family protein [bacterium]MBU1984068.1 mechanosensitive ion channel family protein [bacterium]
MEQLLLMLKSTVLGLTVGQILLALLFVLSGFIARAVILAVFRWLLRRTTATRTQIDDILIEALSAPAGAVCVVGGIWAAIAILPVPREPVDIARFVDAFFRSITIVIATWFTIRLNDRVTRRAHEKAVASDSPLADFVPLLRKTIQVFLVIIGCLLIVQELGYSVGSLIAGLGIGGLAVGLAARDTLANFFGSIVIFVDRPFTRGDWIVVGDQEGIVEDIGVRVTRIRTFANSLITIPNAQLTTTAITNWSRMVKRRINLTIGVTYSTSPETIEAAIRRVEQIILDDDRIHSDFFFVKFVDFAAYSLNIQVYCFTVTTAWIEHLTARQELLLKIMRAFREMGIEFAFPTQTIHAFFDPGTRVIPPDD